MAFRIIDNLEPVEVQIDNADAPPGGMFGMVDEGIAIVEPGKPIHQADSFQLLKGIAPQDGGGKKIVQGIQHAIGILHGLRIKVDDAEGADITVIKTQRKDQQRTDAVFEHQLVEGRALPLQFIRGVDDDRPVLTEQGEPLLKGFHGQLGKGLAQRRIRLFGVQPLIGAAYFPPCQLHGHIGIADGNLQRRAQHSRALRRPLRGTLRAEHIQHVRHGGRQIVVFVERTGALGNETFGTQSRNQLLALPGSFGNVEGYFQPGFPPLPENELFLDLVIAFQLFIIMFPDMKLLLRQLVAHAEGTGLGKALKIGIAFSALIVAVADNILQGFVGVQEIMASIFNYVDKLWNFIQNLIVHLDSPHADEKTLSGLRQECALPVTRYSATGIAVYVAMGKA